MPSRLSFYLGELDITVNNTFKLLNYPSSL